jgi:hypothetical protein
MRGLLATRTAVILGVYHRILHDSENRLWDLVARIEGPQWTEVQDAALGVVQVTPERGERAALELYAAPAARTSTFSTPSKPLLSTARWSAPVKVIRQEVWCGRTSCRMAMVAGRRKARSRGSSGPSWCWVTYLASSA